jgi:ankyrin repeat protein
MANPPEELLSLARAIARQDPRTEARIRTSPSLAREVFRVGASRQVAVDFFLREIGHYVYAGDTLLHIAAAAYATRVARVLVEAGADVCARNRRGAEPLHYASDGRPGAATWNPPAQAKMVTFLIASGADPNSLDKSGVAALHRAVRTRCTGAVRALLAGGADPRLPNKNGSTACDLASRTTGRGGSGSEEARAEQRKIQRLLDAAVS